MIVKEKIYQFEIERVEVDEDKITATMFKEFLILQESGVYNMVSPDVRDHLGISKKQHHYMLKHFEDLKLFFNEKD